MSKISEFESAVLIKISPDLLRWFTLYSPKKDKVKLHYEEKDGVYYFDKDELEAFNRYLSAPWPKPPSGTRPTIPLGIQNEIKKEAAHSCPVCRANIGELAHIEPVSKTLNNHPHNLIYLCPNHHTVYDYGHLYKNVSKEDIDTYKKSLLTFQITQWKLQGNLINSYLSAINVIRRIKGIEDKILNIVNSAQFEELFTKIVNKVTELKNLDDSSPITQFVNTVDVHDYDSNKEKAYNYLKLKQQITSNVKKSKSLIECPICNGIGSTEFYETCPACYGEGLLTKHQINNIDFSQYDVEDCPLCEGHGRTDDYEECPPCGGSGKLSREQKDMIDFSQYDVVDCPLCEGHGRTADYEECPPCGGSGKLSREQKDMIDFSQYDVMDCPLCNGHGRTDDYEECPPCGGSGKLSREQKDMIDFSQYDVVDCHLCKGHGRTDDYEECPPCGGSGKLSREQKDMIDFSQYDVVDCPLCEGHGTTDDYEKCPPCGGSGKLSREQKEMIDLNEY
jgi:RecJ-like exonuclease